jgi:hypothetical protein
MRIETDEISHRKGQRYLTVVVDYHRGRLVWAAAGRDRQTVLAFSTHSVKSAAKQIELVLQTEQLYPGPGGQQYPAPAAEAEADGCTVCTSRPPRPTASPRATRSRPTPRRACP